MDLWQIISGVLGVIALISVIKWRAAKHLLKDVAKLMTNISDALEDDEVTVDELKSIVASGKDVILAAKEFLGK